jgi:5-methyltetrahydrofolate--homocysteine methyltransferase
MLIIGEKINTSRKEIAEAVEKRDASTIQNLAQEQADAGAQYIDVNAGTFRNQEAACLCWLVETVQQAVDLPLCLDTASPVALSKAIAHHRGEPMINSISLERDRYEGLLDIVTSHPCRIVALCMGASAMPKTVEERVQAGSELITRLTDAGIPTDKIYVDPLVQPVAVDVHMGTRALEAVRAIMTAFPGVHTISGLSNVSYGLPKRRLINRTFLALSMAFGLSAAILDPTDKLLMAALRTAEMLLGHDAFCEKFLDAYSEGLLP